MTQEETERRQQILDAAFAEFAHKGFSGATIKSIARVAGLQSPSLIYWYFPTKEALFEEVVASRSQFLQAVFHPEALMEQTPQAVLTLLAQGYLDMTQQPAMPKLARLVVSELIKRPEMAEMLAQRILLRVINFLKAYFTHQIEIGRLRPHDVRVSARAFMGMLIPQALGVVLFTSLGAESAPNQTYIEAVVDIFLTGLRPEPASPE